MASDEDKEPNNHPKKPRRIPGVGGPLDRPAEETKELDQSDKETGDMSD